MHVDVEYRQRFRSDGECHSSFLTRLQRNAFEALQLHYGLGDRSNSLVNVKLWHFIALARSGIGHIHAYLRCPRLHNLLRLDLHAVELKRGVTESKSQRKQRLARRKLVAGI